MPISNLFCPFCKQHPGLKIFQKYNADVCMLKSFDIDTFDHRWHYAWCTDCYSLKECVEKTCAGSETPSVRDWRCEECDRARLLDAPDIVAKPCPGCGVMTEKRSGCSHITCTNCEATTGTATHWCFVCNGKFDYHSIYAHMSRKHGGYGFDANNHDDYDSGYDSDY